MRNTAAIIGLLLAPWAGAETTTVPIARETPVPVSVRSTINPFTAALPGAPVLSAKDQRARIDAVAARPQEGVFIQQEHEGNLAVPSPESSGNVFSYYHPTEFRPDLMDKTIEAMGRMDRFLLRLRRPGSLEAMWDSLPLEAKLDYQDRLEKAVTAESGENSCWSGKVCLLLKKRPAAPAYLAENAHMETPRAYLEGRPHARFLLPEIVTAKEFPAATIDEAIVRSRRIVKDTGHGGIQFQIFTKQPSKALLAGMERIQSVLQLVNNVLFLQAASASPENLTHNALLPWHSGRSERALALIERADARPSDPHSFDPDSEKHAYVAFRHWGTDERGTATVSFELRGVDVPIKRPTASVARDGMALDEAPERDYTAARRYSAFFSRFVSRLNGAGFPDIAVAPLSLDAVAADRMIDEEARAMGLPKDRYLGVEAFTQALVRAFDSSPLDEAARVRGAHPAFLFPFAAAASGYRPAEFDALVAEFLNQSARLKAAEDSGRSDDGALLRNIQATFWVAYSDWARAALAGNEALFERLLAELLGEKA